ncbi:hypothetical protein P43SY_011918 [Pythium insidiosum]|uniref:Uncharacterized protein n=1 Tax=Pythium insidiosum TaxID=114742 RepID=A0AAD5L6W2_PYTIN|nr:hypothetical protein P43SY_011918 [Pythium insidiosum]
MARAYKLQHPGSCSGMFWRQDPRPNAVKGKQVGGAEWPRNGSILIGEEHDVGGVKYLEVASWKQAGGGSFIEGCQGLWMLFDQGGLLLHPTTI